MGTILASSIITKASTVLFDVIGIEWSRLELLGWLNDGQRQIVTMAPSANNRTVAIPLVRGTRQSIPADGWTLLAVYRNFGTDGSTPGRSVRLVARKMLDAFNPNWHADPTATVVQDYLFDPMDQTKFWVYPPSDGTGSVEVNYSSSAADLTAETQPIAVNDVFEPMLLDYILARACSKDSEFSPGMDLAEKYMGSFTTNMTAKIAAETASNPNGELKRVMPGAPE